MVCRERPARAGPGTDELRRRRLLAVPAPLVRDVHGLLARDAGAPRRRHRAVGERLQQLPPPLSRAARSEEHTSELQSLTNLVCRLLLEKKDFKPNMTATQGTV